jgi:hypothetical protein
VSDLRAGWADADEGRHADVAVESWWWWGRSPRAELGCFVGFELRGNRFDYWAGLVRNGHPYLYVEELDGTGLRQGLEIKPPQMWADHVCDVPFSQWSLGNEAHGVLIDDADEAMRTAFGTPVPVTFDIEWYASSPADEIANGYRQLGEVDVRVELLEGVLEIRGPGERVHVWGAPYVPSDVAMPVVGDDERAPYRRSDGRAVDQALTAAGWHARAVAIR